MSSRWHGVVQIGEGLFQIGFGECLWGRTIMPSLSFLIILFLSITLTITCRYPGQVNGFVMEFHFILQCFEVLVSSRWHGVEQMGEGLFQIGFGECLWGRTIMPSLSFLFLLFLSITFKITRRGYAIGCIFLLALIRFLIFLIPNLQNHFLLVGRGYCHECKTVKSWCCLRQRISVEHIPFHFF